MQTGLSIFMSVVESAIFLHRHGMLHGSSIRASNSKKLSKLLKKAVSVLGTALELSPEHSFSRKNAAYDHSLHRLVLQHLPGNAPVCLSVPASVSSSCLRLLQEELTLKRQSLFTELWGKNQLINHLKTFCFSVGFWALESGFMTLNVTHCNTKAELKEKKCSFS